MVAHTCIRELQCLSPTSCYFLGFSSSIFSQNINSLFFFPCSYQLPHLYVNVFQFPACSVLDSQWRYKPAHQSQGMKSSWISPRWEGFSSVPTQRLRRGQGGGGSFIIFVLGFSFPYCGLCWLSKTSYKSEVCILYWYCNNIGRSQLWTRFLIITA